MICDVSVERAQIKPFPDKAGRCCRQL